jgi:hypothetical protein
MANDAFATTREAGTRWGVGGQSPELTRFLEGPQRRDFERRALVSGRGPARAEAGRRPMSPGAPSA